MLSKVAKASQDRKLETEEVKTKQDGIILDSSMVEHTAVNRGVVGSSPTRGVCNKQTEYPLVGTK